MTYSLLCWVTSCLNTWLTYPNSMALNPSWESNGCSINFYNFMEHENSLPCSQKPAIYRNAEGNLDTSYTVSDPGTGQCTKPSQTINGHHLSIWSRDSLVGIATGYGLNGPDLVPGRRNISLFSTTCRTSVGPIHPTTQWVPVLFVPGSKASGAWHWWLTSILCRGQERWNQTSTPQYVFLV
jgi:predicted lipoprotein with Yx(FWY)xxD motif